ncbi:putative PAS/PAC sensing his kinase [Haloarcula marismortui ATCC 33799]|uniref:Putative PAS/PAC sensing his kinase n=1 Tax=Haloarcula marismortui ATCC 33799 TaxID=662475 RepID=M0JNB9_9EURY|nr:putative PAS/PAC sensing his kinase [Haloarcula californiae ATCC 33799]
MVIIIGLMVTSGVVSGYVALFAWQRRSMPGAIGLGVLALPAGGGRRGYRPRTHRRGRGTQAHAR